MNCARYFAAAIATLLADGVLFAQDLQLSPAVPAQTVSIVLQAGVPAGGSMDGAVIATIAPGWHINSATPLDDFAIPTTLKVEAPEIESTEARFPPHVERTFDFAKGKLAVYEGTIQIPFKSKVRGTPSSVRATLRYQACNDSVCLPPKTVVATATPAGSATRAQITGTSAPTTVTATHVTEPAASTAATGSFTPLSQAPRGKPSVFSTDIAATYASRGIAITLLAVLVLGFLLNATPCVYPLIPMTVAYFSSQSEGKRSRQILLPVCYILGIATTYSALGVFAALAGKLFGGWLQHPGVLIFFAMMMIALAASMFGMYEIRVPHFISDRAGAKAGYPGALTMGLLAGVVAAPCVAPVVISLISFVSQSKDPLLGFILFFTLAVGLGLPFLLLGIFSTRLSAMPRSGEWLVQIKKAMGFILIAMAFYFLRPLTGDLIYRLGVGASLIFGAMFLVLQRKDMQARKIRYVCALILLIGGIVFLIPPKTSGIIWTPLTDSQITNAATLQKPVMIDFYADWCLPCKELDAKTFSESKVIKASERFVRLKADLTSSDDPRVQELSQRFKIVGVPTIVFLDSTGREQQELRLSGFEKPEAFLDRMSKAR